MKKVSVDIAKTIDITTRRNDSFYLKIELSNDDGTIYDIVSENGTNYLAYFEVYNSDELVLGFTSNSSAVAPTIASTITVVGSEASLVIESNAASMSMYSGTYKYKLYVYSATDQETNTVMVGKFKVIDL